MCVLISWVSHGFHFHGSDSSYCNAVAAESIKHAVFRYDKQASSPTAKKIAKHGKPFTVIKEAFLSCSDALFESLPNKETIKSRIKDIPTSAIRVQQRINEMAENVRAQQTAGLKDAAVFSIALDESVDVTDIPRLAVMTRYCDSTVREDLCCLKPMP